MRRDGGGGEGKEEEREVIAIHLPETICVPCDLPRGTEEELTFPCVALICVSFDLPGGYSTNSFADLSSVHGSVYGFVLWRVCVCGRVSVWVCAPELTELAQLAKLAKLFPIPTVGRCCLPLLQCSSGAFPPP